MRERALPAATILTPNHFELDLLSGLPSTDIAGVREAVNALHARGPRVILVTSLVARRYAGRRARHARFARMARCRSLRTPKEPIDANGAGDVTAALFLAHWLRTRRRRPKPSRSPPLPSMV